MQLVKLVTTVCALAWMTGTGGGAKAQDGAPQLMLDTGGHMALIRGLVFTPDGMQLVSAGNDKLIRVWDLQAGKTVRTIRGQMGPGREGTIYAIALSPDGRWLAGGGVMATFNGSNHTEIGAIRLNDFATGKLVALLKGHTNAVFALAFSPDAKWLISGSYEKTAIVWDVETRMPIHQLKGHKGEINAVGFTPDGARVVTGSSDTTLKLWSVGDGNEIATLAGHKDAVRSIAISPLDGTIASGSHGDDGEIRLWDGTTGQYLRTLANQGTEVGALSFSQDGKRLVSGNGARRGPFPIHVWEVATGEESLTYTKHDNTVFAAAVSPGGRLTATGGGNNKQIHIWDLTTGDTKQLLLGTGATSRELEKK